MKQSLLSSRAACANIFTMLTLGMSAQLREPFHTLDSSYLGSNFFYPQSHNTIPVPDPHSDGNVLTASQCASLFMSFSRAALDSTLSLSDFSRFREIKDSVAHREGCYSLALLDVRFDDFREDALTSGLIYRQEGFFFHAPGCYDSPCRMREAFVLWADAPHVEAKTYRFRLDADAWVTNYEEVPDSIQIDFDDGVGFRALNTGEIYTVDYSDEARDRLVRCLVWRNGQAVKHSTCVLKSMVDFNPCANSTFPYPQLAPWTTDVNQPWDLHIIADGVDVKGRAYTLPSEDGVFDKPFVFVEGIDFGVDRDGHPMHEEHRHGTFGWCEFTSGFQDPDVNDDFEYGYDNLQRMPQLLNALRSQGYDLVLVDFYDGAEELSLNARLVEEVIRLCNAHKVGEEPLIVAGASMGGVISRYALRDMELNGEDPCARLWISFDAPHKGAHIPRALQEAIKFSIEHGGASAQLFRDRFLLRPAAQQLLDVQVFNDMSEFNDWYGLLDEMGYPTTCRKIAISNGLSNGEGLTYSSQPLLDWDCELFGQELAEFYLHHESGNTYHPWSMPGLNVLAEFTQPTAGLANVGDELLYWYGGLFVGLLDVVDLDHDIVYTPASTPNRDYAPGGKRNTLQTLARAISNERINVFNLLEFDNPCPDVQPNEYNRDHAFVLTSSAVGIATDDPYVNVDQYLDEHPEEDYFDRVWFAQLHNENHTELTAGNLNFVLDEVIGGDVAQLDTVLTANSPNSGRFNYGRPEFSYLRDIHVHSGGRLFFNAYVPTHFNTSDDYLSTDFNFEVNTLECAAADVRVDHDALMQLGDPSMEYRTAQVTIGRDSRVEIGAGGTLRICEGSTLILEEGAVLEIRQGGKLELLNGYLVVRSGAELRFSNGTGSSCVHEVLLSGNDARMVFDGGILKLAARTTLTVSEDSEFTGYLEILQGTENVLHMDTLSVFHWKGRGPDDLMLRIVNGARLQNAQWALGAITLENGLVDLTYNGAIYTDAHFNANRVKFFASDHWEAEGSEVWVWTSQCTVDSCFFEHVDLRTVNTKAVINTTDFAGPNAGFYPEESRFMVSDCAFEQAMIQSESAMVDFYVKRCVFSNDAYIYDNGLSNATIDECVFSDGNAHAIEKVGGTLNLRCNQFNSIEGVYVHQGSVNMSSMHHAGYNFFHDVPVCITCDEVIDLQFFRGYNDFSGYRNYVIAGVMDTTCSLEDACDLLLDAHYNYWGGESGTNVISNEDGLFYPNSTMFDLHAMHTTACNSYESGTQCAISFQDVSPTRIKECPSGFPQAERSLSLSQQQGSAGCAVHRNGDQLTITSQDAILACSIYDILGRRVVVTRGNGTPDNEVHVTMAAEQAAGYYMLLIETASGMEVHRGYYE